MKSTLYNWIGITSHRLHYWKWLNWSASHRKDVYIYTIENCIFLARKEGLLVYAHKRRLLSSSYHKKLMYFLQFPFASRSHSQYQQNFTFLLETWSSKIEINLLENWILKCGSVIAFFSFFSPSGYLQYTSNTMITCFFCASQHL